MGLLVALVLFACRVSALCTRGVQIFKVVARSHANDAKQHGEEADDRSYD